MQMLDIASISSVRKHLNLVRGQTPAESGLEGRSTLSLTEWAGRWLAVALACIEWLGLCPLLVPEAWFGWPSVLYPVTPLTFSLAVTPLVTWAAISQSPMLGQWCRVPSGVQPESCLDCGVSPRIWAAKNNSPGFWDDFSQAAQGRGGKGPRCGTVKPC